MDNVETSNEELAQLNAFLMAGGTAPPNEMVQMGDIENVRAWASLQLQEYMIDNPELPENVEKVLQQAATTEDRAMRAELIEKAKRKLEVYCLATGKKWTKKMSEETKEALRVAKEEKAELKRPLVTQPDGTQAPAPKKPKAAPTEKAPKKSAKAIWQDPEAQAEKIARYPWAKVGSFVQDPEAAGKTNLTIICQAKLEGCEGERVIHAADLFQVKRCTTCQKKSKGK